MSTPLPRSLVGRNRENMDPNLGMDINDEGERREKPQQQPGESNAAADESTEANETIRKCMDLYNGNKLSRDNAWDMSLIDTLYSLADRHHKSLSNFKLAACSLEASSRVYSLRVDSIYLEAMRMAASLNRRKLTEHQLNAADNEEANDDVNTVAGAAPKPKKRARRSTVTKNRASLNAPLETVSLQDSIFAKLNSTVGSINAPNRLMHNILPTRDSELQLRSNYRFWDSRDFAAEEVDYTSAVRAEHYEPQQLASAKWAQKLLRYDQELVLRPMRTGYVISDEPNSPQVDTSKSNGNPEQTYADLVQKAEELSMAFDINAECQPMPDLDAQPAVLAVDSNDLEELTMEEQMTLQSCRGLRKQPVIFEDLRPVDGTSKLEYSYRPMEGISHFWAGPSYWKINRPRGPNNKALGGATRRPNQQAARQRSQSLNFGESHDELFLPIEAGANLSKANFQKWDAHKLVRPTKYNFDPKYFFSYEYAKSIKVTRRFGVPDSDSDDENEGNNDTNQSFNDVELFDNELFTPEGEVNEDMGACSLANVSNASNDTVLEISTGFEGAPKQVSRVIVPFAKRAKAIDMKNLKISCNTLIKKQLLAEVDEASIPAHPSNRTEKYANGMASFKKMYDELPKTLTPKMADSLSPSVALYAVLHVASDKKLRLIPGEDMKDFTIRQISD